MSVVRQNDDLLVKPVEHRSELQRALRLMALSTGTGEGSLLNGGAHSSETVQREHTRIAVLNGDIAGVVRLTAETLRLGESRLRAALVHDLTVPEHYRDRGVADALMDDVNAFVQHHGYHIGLLFGNPYRYRPYGYTEVFSETVYASDASESVPADVPDDLKWRLAKPGDIAALHRLYTKNYVEIPFALVRNKGNFARMWDVFAGAVVLTTDAGKVVGYLLPRVVAGKLDVLEVGMESSSLTEAIVGLSGVLAEEHCVHGVRFHLPADHAFVRTMNGRFRRETPAPSRSGNGLARIIDFSELFENMIPEWEALADTHAVLSLRCEVTLVIDEKSFRIRSNRGAVDIAQIPGQNKFSLSSREFIQMLTGSIPLDEVYGRHHRLVSSEGKDLLRVLFPKRFSYLCPADRLANGL